jgi:archaellum biogenesis protein FlaJ (TadC family)
MRNGAFLIWFICVILIQTLFVTRRTSSLWKNRTKLGKQKEAVVSAAVAVVVVAVVVVVVVVVSGHGRLSKLAFAKQVPCQW